jgi:hypothetical protein
VFSGDGDGPWEETGPGDISGLGDCAGGKEQQNDRYVTVHKADLHVFGSIDPFAPSSARD